METTQSYVSDALIGDKLTLEAFHSLSGEMAGYPFVKIVVEVKTGKVHFMNDKKFKLHAKYIAFNLLGLDEDGLCRNIDDLNNRFYYGEDREFYLGILALNTHHNDSFFTLETVDVDDMHGEMLKSFYQIIRDEITHKFPLFVKPANHLQETAIGGMTNTEVPRVFAYELMAAKDFVALNAGEARGRLRYFNTIEEYNESRSTLNWFDILAMKKVPEDIPRMAGIINTKYTTPLSHTNVLACGWQIPNCIQIDSDENLKKLDGKWVYYKVSREVKEFEISEIVSPDNVELMDKPDWASHQVTLESPKVNDLRVLSLDNLRAHHASTYGTKAANLGEMNYLLNNPSQKMLGFYTAKRYPRPHLLDYLAKRLSVEKDANLLEESHKFVKELALVPAGICIPFSYQRKFLEKSPQIQQVIGKLKMALELNSPLVESLCIKLQNLIIATPIPKKMKKDIEANVLTHLSGVETFVVRSSSNAEDLEHFSAAGIYESYNHITDRESIFESIKKVWASLVGIRSVRLREEVGISLDDCYMAVIIQEEVKSDLGGVMVTTNPLNPKNDYRNVYLNVSTKSAIEVVQGSDHPFQILYNIVEGGGRTLERALDSKNLSAEQLDILGKLALAGKLLQSYFSPDEQYKLPVDIEWAIFESKVYLLQIRPYVLD